MAWKQAHLSTNVLLAVKSSPYKSGSAISIHCHISDCVTQLRQLCPTATTEFETIYYINNEFIIKIIIIFMLILNLKSIATVEQTCTKGTLVIRLANVPICTTAALIQL